MVDSFDMPASTKLAVLESNKTSCSTTPSWLCNRKLSLEPAGVCPATSTSVRRKSANVVFEEIANVCLAPDGRLAKIVIMHSIKVCVNKRLQEKECETKCKIYFFNHKFKNRSTTKKIETRTTYFRPLINKSND